LATNCCRGSSRSTRSSCTARTLRARTSIRCWSRR
jgi:hypothetical protein